MSTAPQRRPTNGGVVIPTDPITLGNVLAKSGYFADSRDAAQAAVKVMAGQELGFGPIASMTGVYIVKGRVTLSANLMGAAIRNSGRCDFRVREHTDQCCRIEFYGPQLDGSGMELLGTSEFTMDDAKRAGLDKDETYRRFPRNMLYARALSNGAKWYCPDVFGGGPAYTPDELTDRVSYDADGQIVAVAEDAMPAVQQVTQVEPTGEIVDPDEHEFRSALVAACRDILDTGIWTNKGLQTRLVAAGAADTSSVRAAVASMPRAGADELHAVMCDLLAEHDAQAGAAAEQQSMGVEA